MAFSLYYVDADLVKPSELVCGAGAVCRTYQEAQAELKRFEASPLYRNVRIERRQYGA